MAGASPGPPLTPLLAAQPFHRRQLSDTREQIAHIKWLADDVGRARKPSAHPVDEALMPTHQQNGGLTDLRQVAQQTAELVAIGHRACSKRDVEQEEVGAVLSCRGDRLERCRDADRLQALAL